MATKVDTDITYISEALAAAQAEYKLVKATAINPNNNTTHAPLHDLVLATREALTKYKLAVVTTIESEGDHVLLTVSLTFKDQSYKSCVQLPARTADMTDPVIEFYVRKMYEGLTGVIVEEGTTLEEVGTAKEDGNVEYERVTEEQAEVIAGELGSRSDIAKSLFRQFSVTRISDLPREHYRVIVRRIQDNKRL